MQRYKGLGEERRVSLETTLDTPRARCLQGKGRKSTKPNDFETVEGDVAAAPSSSRRTRSPRAWTCKPAFGAGL